MFIGFKKILNNFISAGFVYIGLDNNDFSSEVFVLESPRFHLSEPAYLTFDLYERSMGPQLKVIGHVMYFLEKSTFSFLIEIQVLSHFFQTVICRKISGSTMTGFTAVFRKKWNMYFGISESSFGF